MKIESLQTSSSNCQSREALDRVGLDRLSNENVSEFKVRKVTLANRPVRPRTRDNEQGRREGTAVKRVEHPAGQSTVDLEQRTQSINRSHLLENDPQDPVAQVENVHLRTAQSSEGRRMH